MSPVALKRAVVDQGMPLWAMVHARGGETKVDVTMLDGHCCLVLLSREEECSVCAGVCC